LLKLPRRYKVVALLILGYPAGSSTEEAIGGIPARPRKSMSDIVSYNSFGREF